MAYYLVTFECPDCAHSWKQRMGPSEPWPRFCTGCGADMEATDEPFMPMAPNVITGTMGKSGDQVFRQMEAASERRMEMAAEATGIDKAELSDMKVTNIRDNARVGENSVITQSTEVTKFMEGPGKEVTGFKPAGGQYGLGRPDMGAATAGTIQSLHQQNIQATVAAGRQG